MTSLPPEDLLQRVLELESRQDYRNRAAVGGLSRFAGELMAKSPHSQRVSLAALALASYEVMDEAGRHNAVAEALRRLAALPSGDDGTPTGTSGRQEDGKVVRRRAKPAAPRPKRKPRDDAKTEPGLDSPVNRLGGAARWVEGLSRAGVHTIRELLYYLPREHVDFRQTDAIRKLRYGERKTVVGLVRRVRTRYPRKGLTITSAVIADESGAIEVTWFNQSYLAKQLEVGRRIAITGQIDSFDQRLVLVPRDYEWVGDQELIHAGRLVPIYPLNKGLFQKSLRSLMRKAVLEFAPSIPEYLPDSILAKTELLDESAAVSAFHFPADELSLGAAQRRLAFDELLAIEIGLIGRRLQIEAEAKAESLRLRDADVERFVETLGFSPTRAQHRVMADVRSCLASSRPMTRLLQGDVGSGKTVVAAFCLFSAGTSGFQGALMAPTEILATQHAQVLRRWLEPLGLKTECLVGSTPAAERRRVLDTVEKGVVDVLIGTHTLFQEQVEFERLAMVVVDEQHRFGVDQRTRLRQKGVDPHVLAMTATPIPRTLALTVYADLDISTLDELPPGRKPIETALVPSAGQAYDRVREEIEAGRQAFVVCPVIEESSETDTKSAIAEFRRLQQAVFRDKQVALLHGRMKAKEKECVLKGFRDREFDVLVATSVVEVGIDIPNASVMVIRDAHRFGLAQLHQLRGRIGRGGERSFCLLVSEAMEGPARERLEAVVASQDGFRLAEADLRLRGHGDFWGTRQSGMPELKAATLDDGLAIQQARDVAFAILKEDLHLESEAFAPIREHVERFWESAGDLS
ncbi:MAG TPA: ATP-dependent DNA helicase RecG [Chloroflexota bacterium]|nr:ATP-dependent DNA helicase RecG [Chloroflexota bacterium]